jgi:hypothetical protein
VCCVCTCTRSTCHLQNRRRSLGGQIDGFKDSAEDAFWRPAEGFFRPIFNSMFNAKINLFVGTAGHEPPLKMPNRIVRILAALIRAHAAHMFCATPVLTERQDLRKRPKMPSEGSERPSFGRFFGSSARCQFISTRGYPRCTCICRIHAVKRRRGIYRNAPKIPLEAKIHVLLPILRFPRFRAHDAHAFTQRERTSHWPALKDPFLRASRRLLSPFSPIFRFSKRTAAIGYAVLADLHTLHASYAQVGCDSHKSLCHLISGSEI